MKTLLLTYFICLATLSSLQPLFSQHSSYELPEHLRIALKWEGQTEVTYNRSPLIDSINRAIGIPIESSYCAAAASVAILKSKAEAPRIRTGRAVNFITAKSISAKKVALGLVIIPTGSLVIWRNGETNTGHVGFVTKEWSGATGKTFEANTSSGIRGDQRNGDGFYRRTRSIVSTEYFRIVAFTPVDYE